MSSQAERLARLSRTAQAAFWASLSDAEAEQLEYDWRGFWARANQIAPEGDWQVWLFLAGRGAGKTKAGAEWIRENVAAGKAGRIALVGPTAADARDIMVEGPAGILACAPPWDRPEYEPSKRRLTWANGAVATTYSADEPERLRGPNSDLAWCDELCSWRYGDAWSNLMLGLRLGGNPQCLVTTTPKPVKLLREIMADPGTIITRGSTYENRANLAPSFFRRVVERLEGTRLGRQEIHAELLDDLPGALLTRAMVEAARLPSLPRGLPDYDDPDYHRALATALGLTRIVVAVDPSGSDGEDEDTADEIGIVAMGMDADEIGYVLEDASGHYSPEGWGAKAVELLNRWGGDRIVAEANFGGAMVESTIRVADRSAPVKLVTASRGKVVRAEPVTALYEKGRMRHVGTFPALEDQFCAFTRHGYQGKGSPDRADAAVFAATELLLGKTSSYDLGALVGR